MSRARTAVSAAGASERYRCVALVTGGNKGIGLAICQALATSKKVDLVLLGSRSVQRGFEAVRSLRAHHARGVELLELDVESEESVKKAVERVRREFGRLDILVQNAGRAFKGDALTETIARETLATNYFGVRRVFDHFLPLMSKHKNSRAVVVSSMAGRSALRKMSDERRAVFTSKELTLEALDKEMSQFIEDVKSDERKEKGWPGTAYGVSKAGVSTLVRVLHRTEKKVRFSACCPGWVRTDMTSDKAKKSPAQGAETPVYLCLEKDLAKGKFWSDKKIVSYT